MAGSHLTFSLPAPSWNDVFSLRAWGVLRMAYWPLWVAAKIGRTPVCTGHPPDKTRVSCETATAGCLPQRLPSERFRRKVTRDRPRPNAWSGCRRRAGGRLVVRGAHAGSGEFAEADQGQNGIATELHGNPPSLQILSPRIARPTLFLPVTSLRRALPPVR